MNYEKLSLEELEELFLQQREHHYALTEAVRNSRDALAGIMNAVNDKRKGNGGVSFDGEIEEMFQSIRNQQAQLVTNCGVGKAQKDAEDALVYAKPGEKIRMPSIFRDWSCISPALNLSDRAWAQRIEIAASCGKEGRE